MNKCISFFFIFFLSSSLLFASVPPAGIIVFQSDFGLKDGAVNAVKGVMYGIDKSLIISDSTHEIPSYNIRQASYWLAQVAPFWPKGTVFISVVDPGVGTKRRSIVAETNNGYYFVTPDNGTLTDIAETYGIKQARQIDESKNRLKGSDASFTFHGRDVYGYTAAKLASGKINFTQVGPELTQPIVKFKKVNAIIKNHKIYGDITVLDPQYGNIWTNISDELVKKFKMYTGHFYKVTIRHHNQIKYQAIIPLQNTFGDVEIGKNVLYLNSLMNLAIGTNQGNFAKNTNISSGPEWHIMIEETH